jgi:hypothetical protein
MVGVPGAVGEEAKAQGLWLRQEMFTVLICSVLLVEAEAVSLYWQTPWPDRSSVLRTYKQNFSLTMLAAMLSREATAVCRLDIARELASRPSVRKDLIVIHHAQSGDTVTPRSMISPSRFNGPVSRAGLGSEISSRISGTSLTWILGSESLLA